jgi:hypothetical protein
MSKGAKKHDSANRARAARAADKPNGKPGAKPTSHQVHHRRSGLLIVVYALLILHSAFAVYLGWITKTQEAGTQGLWTLSVLMLAAVGVIIATVGMWYWKMWGVHLYVATQFVAMAIHLILTGSIWVSFYDLVPVAIVIYILNMNNGLKRFE